MRLDEVLWPNKYILTSIGLWPMPSDAGPARRHFANFRFSVVLSAVTFLFVPELVTIAVHWGDIDVLDDFALLLIIHFLLLLKLLYYKLRERSLSSMYQHVKDFWDISDDPQERRLYEGPANLASVVTIAFYLMIILNLINFNIMALFGGTMANYREFNTSLHHRPLLLEVIYGFDTQRTPTYQIILILQNFCAICATNASVGCDFTLLAFVVHVFAQFKLIVARFHAFGRTISEQLVAINELRFEIGKLIAQHQHTIRVAEELSILQSPMMFCQIMSSGLQICLAGFTLIEGDSNMASLFKFIVLFLTVLIQLVIFCTPAEILIQESGAIADTIYYDVPWFRLTPSLQRDLGFVMTRAQKACHVTALYQVMSIARITEVFNAAGSYMALLRSMKN